MDIIKPDTPKLQSYKLGEFELTTDEAPIKALQRALAMVDQLMAQQGNFGVKIENPFHLEPAAQYVFMMAAKKIESLENRIAELESKLEKGSEFGESVI